MSEARELAEGLILKMMKYALFISCSLLAIIAIGCIAFFVYLPPHQEGWRAAALNLGTEILGILFVVILIDTVIRRRDALERSRYRAVALRHLRFPLIQHLHFLFDLYKAAVKERPDKEISCPKQLFDDDYFEQVGYLEAAP